MSVLGGNPLLLGGVDGDQVLPIQRSVRLRSSASAYFNRTPASTTNRRTFTWSGWVKRGALADGVLITASNGTQYVYFAYSTNALTLQINTGTNYIYTTTAVFRDPSAWYHVVLAIDTTQALDANRVQIYINGVSQARSAGGVPQNTDTQLNVSAVPSWIGSNGGVNTFFDGYLTEVNFIDGQALTPSSFGFVNPTTGVWVPKLYVGTYGTNGFYLNFQDNSAATAAAIGKDSSGNGNNWTPNNINVSAYTGTPSNNVLYDSMIDTPTPYSDGGNNRGNYPTLQVNASQGNGAYTEANLGFRSNVASQWRGAHASIFMPSGKFYFEATIQALSGNNFFMIGACGIQTTSTLYANYTGQVANGWSVQCNGGTGGTKYNNNATINISNASFASWVVNDVLQCAVDVDNGRIWFGKNNVWLEGVPSAGTGASYTNLTGAIAPSVSVYGSGVDKLAVNFGQRPFSYTPPSGFVAVNTFNLAAPTIANGANQFAATIFTATGTTQSITNTVNGASFQPDLLIVKTRAVVGDNNVIDSVRGVSKYLITNTTGAELTAATFVTSFNSNGWTFGTGNYANGTSVVAWQWKASNAAAVTNTAGSVTSSVSANTTAGFSIATFNAGAAGNKTVGHGLGVKPAMIFFKDRTTTGSWLVWHQSLSSQTQSYLLLNTAAASTNDSRIWANTAPTSTVFSFESGYSININDDAVAYFFAEIAGYSRFGSYTGNGVADGQFVYTGFRPAFVLMKNASATGQWHMMDNKRSSAFNVVDGQLYSNLTTAEAVGATLDLTSNGFKIRTNSADINGSTNTIIYAAFAENPFNYSLAR